MPFFGGTSATFLDFVKSSDSLITAKGDFGLEQSDLCRVEWSQFFVIQIIFYICVSILILYYMKILDEQIIYQATDEQILGELHDRLVRMRRSCCFSQQELADLSGVSIATIKRIETQRDKDISLTVLIRLLRTMTQMEGIGTLVPEVPESPFLSLKDGKTAQRVSSKRKRI